MAETFWLDSSDVTFPLVPAAMLLTDPDSNETPTYTEAAEIVSHAFAELSLTGLVIDIENALAQGRAPFVTLAEAHNDDEWGSQRGIESLLKTLAPIIPDGSFATTDTFNVETPKLRYIISGDTVIADGPKLVWDPIEDVIEDVKAKSATPKFVVDPMGGEIEIMAETPSKTEPPARNEQPVVIEFSLTRSFKLDGYVQVPGAHAADEDEIIDLIDQAHSAGELDEAYVDTSKQYTGIELGDVVAQSSHPPAAKFTTEDFTE